METNIENRMMNSYIIKNTKLDKNRNKGLYIKIPTELSEKFRLICEAENINVNATLQKLIQDIVNTYSFKEEDMPNLNITPPEFYNQNEGI